ncbi:MAG TPA: hypothetical protein VIL71_16870 [Spirillospora sp.]
MRLLRRRALPPEVRAALTFDRGERVLASAPTRGGSYAVATTTALHLPTAAGGYTRIPWERVDHATWKDGVLNVQEADGGPQHHLRLTDPGSVPETVRERVTTTIAVSHRAALPGGGTVRIVGRRPATGGDVRWTIVFESGLHPHDPGMRAQAEQILEDLRRQTGL